VNKQRTNTLLKAPAIPFILSLPDAAVTNAEVR
jgi:hypothetical protein